MAQVIPTSLNHLVELIHAELGIDKGLGHADVDVDKVKALMASYKSNEDDWQQFALWDKSKNYTRNLVDDGNGKYFNLMILCWNEGKASPIHDHSGAHCLMKVLAGELVETQFEWPKASSPSPSSDSEGDSPLDQKVPLETAKRMNIKAVTALRRDEVTYMSDQIGLHRVANKTDQPAISLHLYTPAYEYCKTFDENNGVEHCSGRCVFFSKRGQRLPLLEQQ